MAQQEALFSLGAAIARAIEALNAAGHGAFAAFGAAVDAVIGAFETALLAPPAGALIGAVAALSALAYGPALGVLALGALGFCLAAGLWA